MFSTTLHRPQGAEISRMTALGLDFSLQVQAGVTPEAQSGFLCAAGRHHSALKGPSICSPLLDIQQKQCC